MAFQHRVIETVSLKQYETLFYQSGMASCCHCPFVLPFWLRTWFTVFGDGYAPHILAVGSGTSLQGVAPLMLAGDTATFMGSEAVCDYQDMIMPGDDPRGFLTTLLYSLQDSGVSVLKLGALTPASPTLQLLPDISSQMGLGYILEPAGNLSVAALPGSWDNYLQGLTAKHRHEIRRKLRRLNESGDVSFSQVWEGANVSEAFALFLKMFSESRDDKAAFLTDTMRTYFNQLAAELAARKMLRLGILSIGGESVAATFGFEFNGSYFLYNNGFSLPYSNLSVGLLGKVYTIRDSIEKALTSFNFLKGEEKYKRHLGGKTIPLQRIIITL